jgi:hypothetical protein
MFVARESRFGEQASVGIAHLVQHRESICDVVRAPCWMHLSAHHAPCLLRDS